MEGIGKNIGEAILALAILAFIVGGGITGLIWGGISYFSDDEIKVTKPLEPIRTELVITPDNKVDTVYVYEIP